MGIITNGAGEMSTGRGSHMKIKGLIVVAAAVMAVPCQAQSVIIYPAKGQSQSQQDQDNYACHSWATQQSGYNPSQPPPQASPYGPSPLRGAARGAAIGAVGGAIGGDAGKGAGIGAATGALIGAMRRRDQYAQQQSSNSQQQSLYNRAMATCMQGRGYTVG
jgi:Glycine-zipper domain